MPETLKRPLSRPASHYDYAEHLRRKLPAEKKPYILARFALALYGNESYDRFAMQALESLDKANQEKILQPPLSEDIATEINIFVNERNCANGPASAVLLAWALEGRNDG